MHQIKLEKGWTYELPPQYAIYQSFSDFSRYSVLDQEKKSVCSFRITNDTCTITGFWPWQHHNGHRELHIVLQPRLSPETTERLEPCRIQVSSRLGWFSLFILST